MYQNSILQVGRGLQLATHALKVDSPPVTDVIRTIVGHVKIHISVPVNVRQSHGTGSSFERESCIVWSRYPLPAFLLNKSASATPYGREKQIERTILVEVDPTSRATGKPRKSQGVGQRFLFKTPATQISVKLIGSINPAEKNIHPSITIHVSQSEPTAVEEHSVGGTLEFIQ